MILWALAVNRNNALAQDEYLRSPYLERTKSAIEDISTLYQGGKAIKVRLTRKSGGRVCWGVGYGRHIVYDDYGIPLLYATKRTAKRGCIEPDEFPVKFYLTIA